MEKKGVPTGLHVTHPLTGEQTPWMFARPGHHCGAISATPNMMFFRSKSTAFYNRDTDQGTEHRWRLVNRAHGFHHAQHARNDPQSRAGTCCCCKSFHGTHGFVMVMFDGNIEHVIHRIGVETTRGHNHQADGVGDHVDQRVIFHELGIFGEDRGGVRVFHMRFKSHRSVNT